MNGDNQVPIASRTEAISVRRSRPGWPGFIRRRSPLSTSRPRAWRRLRHHTAHWSRSSRCSPAFDRELLLSTLTLYWATNTIATSLLPYWASRESPDAALPVDDPSPVPTAISVFGGERIPLPKPPRELSGRYWHVTSWAEHPVGGHFPAIAEPELLARTLRDAFRPAR